jgi:histidinol-phosphate aminotransferase
MGTIDQVRAAPPPVVMEAMRQAVGEALRLYPDPSAHAVRRVAGARFGVHADQVIVGNGSDDLLTILLRTFVAADDCVAAPDPTYTLYEPLTALQDGRYQAVPWAGPELGLPVDELAATQAKLILLARPNAPTGHVVPLAAVEALCRRVVDSSIVVLDEAYADFADDNGIPLLHQHPNLVVTRSFSKSLSLAGMRLGLMFMSAELARQAHKVRDSYNVDRLAQAAAVAALEHLELFQPAVTAIRQERTRFTAAMRARGFHVAESQANFVLVTVPSGPRTARDWLEALKEKHILVRYFGSDPRLSDKLRITIGRTEEMDLLLAAIDGIAQVTPTDPDRNTV